MKHVLLVLAALAAGALAGYVSGNVRNAVSQRPAEAAAPAREDVLARLEKELAAQREELDGLRSQLALAASARSEAARAAESRAHELAETAAEDEAASDSPAVKAVAPAEFDLDDALARLSTKSMSWEQRQELFARARKSGKLDELIDQMEAWAAERPEDPDAQVLLASAYVAKIQEVGAGPEAGKLAMQADHAYDAALAVDDHHWEARFAKAMSLSFWPPVFGKQTEAIKHFEILAQQQDGLPTKDQFAQTYLMLGNTYQQVGQLDKALAAWQKGLSVFPGNAELAKQIENAKQAQGAH